MKEIYGAPWKDLADLRIEYVDLRKLDEPLAEKVKKLDKIFKRIRSAVDLQYSYAADAQKLTRSRLREILGDKYKLDRESIKKIITFFKETTSYQPPWPAGMEPIWTLSSSPIWGKFSQNLKREGQVSYIQQLLGMDDYTA